MRSFKWIRLPVFCILAALILIAMDYALYPCTFMRNDIHAVTTQTFDDIYMGTSHGKINIDPESVGLQNSRTGHNLCVGGEYPQDCIYMLRLMIEKGHKPERIVYEISPGYLVREKEEGNNYLLFYHEFPVSLAKLSYFMHSVAKCNFRTLFFPWYEYPLSYELANIRDTVRTKWEQDYSADRFRTASQGRSAILHRQRVRCRYWRAAPTLATHMIFVLLAVFGVGSVYVSLCHACNIQKQQTKCKAINLSEFAPAFRMHDSRAFFMCACYKDVRVCYLTL